MLSAVAALSRYRIALFHALCAAAGYMYSAGPALHQAFCLIAAVMPTAIGALILNQYQERETDALMERTRNRPIPSGRCRPEEAVLLASLFLSIGLASVYFCFGTAPLLVCIVSFVLYNGIYTPLKRKSFLSVFPGMIAGALAPLIGWTAAGGASGFRETLLLMLFILMWQLPHFWLLMLRYRNDYARAGLRSVTEIFSDEQISAILFIWINATGASCLLMPLFASLPASIYLAVAAVTAMLLLCSLRILAAGRSDEILAGASTAVNIHAFAFVSALCIGKAALIGS